jgi:hypothetical protein
LHIKKIPEPVCEELQHLTVLVFALSGEFLTNNHFNHATSSKVEALTPPDHHGRVVFCQWLLTKCIVNTQYVTNILVTDEMDSQGTVLGTFLIPMSG